MAYGISQRAAQILLTHGARVLMQTDLKAECDTMGVEYLPQEECLEKTDVILTIGGDGTILHEANLSLEYRKPILGINLGRCGFLATCEINEMEQKLSAVARGDYLLDNRMLLYVRVLGDDSWEGHALNDVVITKGRLQQAIDFSIYCDDILVEHYRGDGVIVATPTLSLIHISEPAPRPIRWRPAGPSWTRRPRAWSSRPSARTAWPARPWCLRRNARSTSVSVRSRTRKSSSAAMVRQAILCMPVPPPKCG